MAFQSEHNGVNFDGRALILCLFTLGVAILACMLRPIPQSPAYHHFADTRVIAGIPNFANVVSNLPFVAVGLIGLLELKNAVEGRGSNRRRLAPVFVVTYSLVFLGILLTGFGSAYYHLGPDNDTLVYDRLPMTVVFMAVLSVTFAETVGERIGALLLLPFILAGTGSVLWWIFTEHRGAGDLRWYGVVQYYPLLLIPLLFVLYPSNAAGHPVVKDSTNTNGPPGGYHRGVLLLLGAVSWYVIAKVCEYFDQGLFSLTGWISGHTLKHLFSAAATWWLVRLFRQKHG